MYEITFITPEETDPAAKKTIEALGGKITANSSLGRRKFAYPIRKKQAGFYTTYIFDLDRGKIEELNKKLLLEEEILRYLIIQKITRKIKEKPARLLKEEISRIAPVEKVEEKIVKEKVEKPPKAKKEVVEKPMRIPVIKPKPPKAVKPAKREIEITEEERLKALEEKLSELLKE